MHRRIATGALLALTAAAHPAAAQSEREIQIRSIDFDNEVLELFNFASADVDLTGWRFCSHDFNEQLRYSGSTGLNAVTIEAGTSVFIHYNNDAPAGDPDRLNRSALGGSFATPLDQDAYGIQIYFPAASGSVSFGNSALIADHLQWNIDGQGVGNAERRTAQAVSQNLWTANGEFIATDTDSSRIDLTDLSGDAAGGPSEYAVSGPPCPADIDGDGDADPDDINAFVTNFIDGIPGNADIDNDGDEDPDDINAFVTAFVAGCP